MASAYRLSRAVVFVALLSLIFENEIPSSALANPAPSPTLSGNPSGSPGQKRGARAGTSFTLTRKQGVQIQQQIAAAKQLQKQQQQQRQPAQPPQRRRRQ
uniref:Pancreatic trypsin inhibitor n=1 Tax=Rhipicephalus appendiculatus TaxID=34631 RepID=A0A131Z7A7_RHIAP